MNIALLNAEGKQCYNAMDENLAMHIGLRIKKLMEAKKISGKEMAAHCGITPGAVSSWFSTGRISKEKLALVADLLKVTTDDLISGDAYQQHEPIDTTHGIHGLVPLIAWVQAGYGVSAVDNLHPGEGERIETTYRARRHTYALRVNGDSMEPKFPQGCIVIVEPEENPQHGKFVIVRQNGDEPTLKQYVEEGSNKYLKPLNPRYPIITMGPDDVFCGVVKRVEMDV